MLEKHKEMLEQTNIQHAIVGEMHSSLGEILGGLNKTRVSSLARTYNISGRSKMKKDELALALQEQIANPAIMESALLILDAEEWEVFEAAYTSPHIQDNFIPFGFYHLLLDLGLVYTYFEQNKLYMIMPDEVKAAYKQLNTDTFRQARRRQFLVLDYIHASTNLYGFITPNKLLEIFNGQNASEPLSRQELDAYLEISLSRQQRFDFESGYLLDSGLAQEEGELESLLDQTQGKPQYVPGKSELLKYADDSYFEITPQLMALKNYILTHMTKDVEMVDYLIDDIQFGCSMELPLQGLMNEFDRRSLVFEDPKQAQQVIDLVTEVYNHTRVWSNCGHTPSEIRAFTGQPRLQPTSPVTPAKGDKPAQARKIGRNEPCPCGSGLKYKKCCGK
ncbi:hypothetical protein D3C76_41200 [compost metagenome]